MPQPSYPTRLRRRNEVWWSVQTVKHVIMQLSPESSYILPLKLHPRSILKYHVLKRPNSISLPWCHRHLLKGNPTIGAYYSLRIKSESGQLPYSRLSQPSGDTRISVTLVARTLFTPLALKLCRCKHGALMSRTDVQSRTLLRIEIICCCSWNI
jgi:hypothetical protein